MVWLSRQCRTRRRLLSLWKYMGGLSPTPFSSRPCSEAVDSPRRSASKNEVTSSEKEKDGLSNVHVFSAAEHACVCMYRYELAQTARCCAAYSPLSFKEPTYLHRVPNVPQGEGSRTLSQSEPISGLEALLRLAQSTWAFALNNIEDGGAWRSPVKDTQHRVPMWVLVQQCGYVCLRRSLLASLHAVLKFMCAVTDTLLSITINTPRY